IEKELTDIRRQLRNAGKRLRAAALVQQPDVRVTAKVQVAAPSLPWSPASVRDLLVFIFSGHDAQVAADFAQGWGRRGCGAAAHAQQAREHLVAEVEWAYIRAPLAFIVQLETNPLEACPMNDVLCASRYVVQHELFQWVERQNVEQGVAPSRRQLVEHALSSVPHTVPEEVRRLVSAVLTGSPRSQRRWLAKFRQRWGARLNKLKLQPCVSIDAMQRWRRFQALGWQAMAYFQWVNEALTAAPTGRSPLVINMDETAVVRHVSGLVGTVVRHPRATRCPKDEATLSDVRSYISYFASITHDRAVQPMLPQVLVGNEHQFPVKLLEGLRPLPHGVHVWRCKSAWNNHATMRRYISLLAKSLGDLVQQRYVILLAECALSHIDVSIFKHALRCGVRLVYVPASMTGVLLPCDTHLFSRFKAAFADMWRRQKAECVAGVVTTNDWVRVIWRAVEEVVMRGDWQQAFESAGVLRRQQRLAGNLREKLGWAELPEVPAGPPAVDLAREIFPQRMRLDVLSYVLWKPKCQRSRESAECSGFRSLSVSAEALLHEEMEALKRRRGELKRQCRQAARDSKVLAKKRQRLLQAAKNLSAEDLQLLLRAPKVAKAKEVVGLLAVMALQAGWGRCLVLCS
ncbi:unnamed protein product, partial [Effrenium voratum]